MDFTRLFVSYIRSFCTRAFSEDEMHQVYRCVLDWLGVSEAGAFALGNRLNDLEKLSSQGSCSCFLSSKRIDAINAAFLNGYAAHVLELDDGHRKGMLHLEALIVTALIAVSQQERLSYEAFVKGMIAGYQTTVKLACLIQPSHKLNGFHATGTCGAIGVASAVAVALNLSETEHINAIGAASTRAAGLLGALDSPSEIKPYNISGAIEVGIRSAYLAKAGFQGPYDPLWGKRGFLRVFAPELDIAQVAFDDSSEILNIYFKPFVSCRHCHAPVEAAIILYNKYKIAFEEVHDIRVETYRLAIDGHDSHSVESVAEAKMSIPFCVAVALRNGSCDLSSFTDEAVADVSVRELMRKVYVIEDENLTLALPEKRGARVILSMKDGSVYEEMVDNPLGEPEHPMSDDMIKAKYSGLMDFAGIDRDLACKFKDMVLDLGHYFDVFLDTI